MEGDPTPNEPPTSRLVLAPDDLDRISAAIRRGLAKEPPDGKKLLREVLALLVGFGLLFLLYLFLTHWRPAVDLNVQANALPPPQVLTFEQDEGDVVWRIGTAQVRALTVEELRAAGVPDADQVTISLPIPSTDCGAVAAQLDTTCDGGVVELRAGVTVAWSVPQVLQLVRTPTDGATSPPDPAPPQVTVNLQGPGESPARMPAEEPAGEAADQSDAAPATPPLPQLTIADSQTASQHWCFIYQEQASATLSISGGSGYLWQFEPASPPDIDCDDGLQLQVTPGAATAQTSDGSQGASSSSTSAAEAPQPSGESQRPASVVTLAGISSLGVTTFSERVDASLAGTLRIGQDVRVFGDETRASISAGEPLRSDLEIQAGSPSLTINGSGVTSIDTDQENLVTTVWQRNPELILPIFLGLVGVLTPLLGAAYRNAVNYLTTRHSTTPSAAR